MKAFLFLLILPLSLFAQKRIENIYDAQNINSIYINSDAIFKISIKAQKVKEISINTIIDGETYESSLLHTKIIAQQLEITTGRTPDFVAFNDKLSVHKVLSIELEITIPQGLDIDIHSTLAEVTLTGKVRDIQVNLGRGGFLGNELRFRESVINTLYGNVILSSKQANVTASSRNGKLTIQPSLNEGPKCTIKSIYGDIEALQVK